MNGNDEELQKKIESGFSSNADDLDVKAYQEVFARLAKKPHVNLSADFADVVIKRIEERQRRSASHDFFWLGFGVSLLIIALIVAAIMSGFRPTLGFLKGMSAYAGVFAFGIAFILFLNRLDKKIVTKPE
jgi:predicted exporter